MHQIGFPINVEIIIPEDDSVRLLYEVRSGLDYSCLYKNYSTIGRNAVITPETLFRILVYGYMECIYSSGELEKACKRDINFVYGRGKRKSKLQKTLEILEEVICS